MTDTATAPVAKSVEELQAEQDALKAQHAQLSATLAAENERLRAEVEKMQAANAKEPTCPACGSPTHKHCALPSHEFPRGGAPVSAD